MSKGDFIFIGIIAMLAVFIAVGMNNSESKADKRVSSCAETGMVVRDERNRI